MTLHAALSNVPLIAILRGVRPEEAIAVGQALTDAHWGVIEVPLNSPEPLRSIASLVRAFPASLVGAGTVLNADQVREVHHIGAKLVVAPNFDRDVVRTAVDLGMVCIPGVCTPSEAFAALDAGATALKLFPAEMIPPAAVKAIRAVLPPSTILLPVGGIGAKNMQSYFDAGANGFGIGSSLFKPGTSAEEVRRAALDFAAACAGTIRA